VPRDVSWLLDDARLACTPEALDVVLAAAASAGLHTSLAAVVAATSPACTLAHLSDATVDVVVLWADGRDGLEHLVDPALARVLRALAQTQRLLTLGEVLTATPAPCDPRWADLVVELARRGFAFDSITTAIADPALRDGITTLLAAGAPAAPDELASLTRSLLAPR
jgi:hypothetical protein